MRAMYLKEAKELAFLVVPMLIAISIAWASSLDMDDAFLQPQEEPQVVVWLVAGAAGILLAYWQFAGERARGTHAYLVHRGLRPGEIVRAKALLGAGAAFLLGIVPPSVSALWHAYADGDGGVFQWARLGEYALLSLTGVSAYAVAAQNAASHQQEAGRAIARFAFVVGVVAAQFWFLLRMFWVWTDERLGSGAVGLVWGVALISVPAFWLASRRFERGLDGSRPVPPREARVTAITSVLFILVPAWMFFGASERMLARKWLTEYPMVLSRGTDEWALGTYDSDSRTYRPLAEVAGDVPDAEDEPWQAAFRPTHPWAERRSLMRPDTLTTQDWRWLPTFNDVPVFEGPQGRFHMRAWILQPAGELRLWFSNQQVVSRREENRVPIPTTLAGARSRVVTARRPDGVPLSPDTDMGRAPDGLTVLLLDPGDQTLWRFAPERLEDALVPLELPDGLTAEEFAYVEGAETRFRPNAVRCGDVALVYLDGGLVPIDEAPELSLRTAREQPVIAYEVRRSGLFQQDLTVRATATDEELFQHSWGAWDGLRFPSNALFAPLEAVQGPIPVAIASSFMPGDPPFTAEHVGLGLALHNPIFFGGHFAWLRILQIALALLLGLNTHRRARRGGLTRLRGGLWTGATLVGGLWVWIVFLLAEPAALRKAAEVEKQPVPRDVLVVRPV